MSRKYSVNTWNSKTKRSDIVWAYCAHPFEQHFIPEGSSILIIGSFPTAEHNYAETFNFFYGGELNRFWEVMQAVFNRQFQYHRGEEAVKERKELLEEAGIGITDMLTSCLRRGKKSQDIDLYPIRVTDIFELLRQYPSITRLILTSRTELVGTLGLLKIYFLQQGQFLTVASEDKDRIIRTSFDLDGRQMEVFVPHSTSASNNKVTTQQLITMYKKCVEQ